MNLPNVPANAPPNETPYLISADGDCRAAYGFDPARPAERVPRLARAHVDRRRADCADDAGSRATGAGRSARRTPTRLTAAQRMYVQRGVRPA